MTCLSASVSAVSLTSVSLYRNNGSFAPRDRCDISGNQSSNVDGEWAEMMVVMVEGGFLLINLQWMLSVVMKTSFGMENLCFVFTPVLFIKFLIKSYGCLNEGF